MWLNKLLDLHLTRYLKVILGVSLLVVAIACGIAGSALPVTVPANSSATANASAAPELTAPSVEPSSTSSASEASAPEVNKPEVNIFVVPMVDTNKAGVPLSDIVFDTFGRSLARYKPFDQADEEVILDLRGAITPIYQPVYGPADDLPWLSDYDLVMGYVSGNAAYAYPINILNLHELVNDEIDGIPVLVSYCPLCVSGVVYKRELNSQVLLFGITRALYQSDLVMYDHQSGSYWFQVGGGRS